MIAVICLLLFGVPLVFGGLTWFFARSIHPQVVHVVSKNAPEGQIGIATELAKRLAALYEPHWTTPEEAQCSETISRTVDEVDLGGTVDCYNESVVSADTVNKLVRRAINVGYAMRQSELRLTDKTLEDEVQHKKDCERHLDDLPNLIQWSDDRGLLP